MNHPEKLILLQNAPNPFNPATTIQYTLPSAEHLSITVYNVLGQKVKTLVAGRMPAGTHRVIWNGRDHHNREVPSGVYVCRMAAPGFTATRKMLLLK